MNNVIGLSIIAAIGGCAVALQGQFMGLMDKSIGTGAGLFINYASGGILIGVILLTLKGGNLKAWTEVPWYALSAGLLGLIIAGSIGYTVPRLGLSTAFTIVVATQFIVAILLDHFGWFGAITRPLEFNRVLGVGTLILGVWLTTK